MQRSARHKTLPLTQAQRGLWMTQFIAPSGSNLNIAEAIHLHGPLHIRNFIAALRKTQAEAETLRTRIIQTPEGPLYEILPHAEASCPIIDCRDAQDPDDTALRWMQMRLRTPLDLAHDELWQNALLRVGETRWIWFHCCHHTVLDGFAGGLIAARVAALYTAFSNGVEAAEAAFLPLATLHEQESAYRASERYAGDRAYWLGQLQDAPEPFSLSLRPHRPPSGEHGGAITRSKMMDNARTEALAALGRAHGSTLPQVLTALLVSYFYRVTGHDDLVVGMPVSARATRALRQTPGMVANAAALRFRIEAHANFAGMITLARRAMRGALRHQQYRYEDLRRDLGLFGAAHQISRIGINIEPFDYDLAFGDLTARNANLSNGAMEDLTIFVFDRQDGNGLCIQCDANPALYTDDELDAHLDRILRLGDAVLASPDAPLETCPLLTETERTRQTERNRRTGRLWPERSLPELINDGIRSGTSMLITDASAVLSREAFLDSLDRLARDLREAGIGPGHLVALALPRDRRMIVCMAAIIRAGAAWLPLDVDAPLPRARLILEDARPSLVVLPDQTYAEWACHYPAWCIDSDALRAHPLSPWHDSFVPAESVPVNTAYVTYTSGTTGRPKGVVVPCSALLNFLHTIRERLAFGAADVLVAVTTWTFDIAVLETLLPLVSGAGCVIATQQDIRDPKRLAALIVDHGVTTMQATPTLWQTLLGTEAENALSGLLLLSGGEALPTHMARQMVRLGRAAYNLYGPTETTIWSTAHRLTPDQNDSSPAGLPLANTRLSIIDRWGHVMPDGLIGELLIAGEGVATGYLNRPDLTTSRFIPDPDGTGAALAYRTGDLAVLDKTGVLMIFGRADQQVKIRGMRIEPDEIESTLLGLPEVLQAAVMVETTGTQTVLAAYLVPAVSGTILDPAQIRRTLLTLLPPQMVPVRLVSVEALPRLTSGKLDRAALRALQEIPSARTLTLASTPAEQMLSRLWCSLLDVEELDINTSFFDLGGDSIMAVEMVAALSAQGYELPVGQVFAAPTIALLAPLFEGGPDACDPLAVTLPIRTLGDKPPLFCIHPVIGMSWSFNTLAPLLPEGHPVYGLQDAGLLLGDSPPLTLEALIRCYIATIRTIQPQGPYHLIGWSMGGVIAQGIAHLLRETGEEIALLTLLDAYPSLPGEGGFAPDDMEALKTARAFLHISLEPGAPEPQTLDDLADLLLAEIDTSLLPVLQGRERGDLEELAEKMRLVARRNLEMLVAHRPAKTDVDILFLRAGQKTDMFITDRPQAWSAFTTGQIVAHDLPCRHGDMLTPGHVETVARLICSHPALAQVAPPSLTAA
ncbi:amino acid adenylation domain-containing protein [Brytella acorum]|uniref:Amino acid adenylation domain-containing protein n=1 Tax=Brytella acorum TaxID=2959299 RepID=A0AA35UIT3_9PROT|nr:amino acid adenylation domain-containing protein [Brytella acorum]CAI9122297.1 amino acid adenylation domain-containing protein [Brytella acorum]